MGKDKLWNSNRVILMARSFREASSRFELLSSFRDVHFEKLQRIPIFMLQYSCVFERALPNRTRQANTQTVGHAIFWSLFYYKQLRIMAGTKYMANVKCIRVYLSYATYNWRLLNHKHAYSSAQCFPHLELTTPPVTVV